MFLSSRVISCTGILETEKLHKTFCMFSSNSVETKLIVLSHANSIDKTPSGDYIVSARHTSTIYLVSGVNGSVLWRFGGSRSDFQLQGFNFSNQHDARVQSVNDTTMVLSLLDNASNNDHRIHPTASVSTALYIALDLINRTAAVLLAIPRPDQGLSHLRGNVQHLTDSGNTVVGWSQNNYVSEHSASGELLAEARWTSSRFNAYRSYKFPWTALNPTDPPIVSAVAYGSDAETLITVLHASWNGATEARSWQFCAVDNEQEEIIAQVSKTGFETVATVRGFWSHVHVKALDEHGQALRSSDVVNVSLPTEWTATSNVVMNRTREGETADTTSIMPANRFFELERRLGVRSRHVLSESRIELFLLAGLAPGLCLVRFCVLMNRSRRATLQH